MSVHRGRNPNMFWCLTWFKQCCKLLTVRIHGEMTNPVPALLHAAPFSRAQHWPAESTHEQSTEALRSLPTTPPTHPLLTSHPSYSVLALWRVNWADLWDRRGGHWRVAFPLEPQTSPLRLEEICSTILWPPAFQGWACTEGRGRDLGAGQAFSSGSLFTPHVPSLTPHWSF